MYFDEIIFKGRKYVIKFCNVFLAHSGVTYFKDYVNKSTIIVIFAPNCNLFFYWGIAYM